MRKIIQLLSIALVVLVVVLTDLTPSNKANADGGECLHRMSEETTRYVREKRIPLTGADSEFYSNKTEQVYLLNSEEKLKLDSRRSVKNTVAVVNHKDANGKGGFYVIEQEITPGKVVFLLKQDSRVLQTLPVRLNLSRRPSSLAQFKPGNPCKDSDCNEINQAKAALIAGAATTANQTCTTQKFCAQSCKCVFGKLAITQDIIHVKPTSWRCREFTAVTYDASFLWALVRATDTRDTGGTLLDYAFDTAIRKEVKLYTF